LGQVLSEISSRGVRDVFVFCVDGPTGFLQAIKGVFPNADIQLCLVHMMRQSLAVVPDKDRKVVSSDLKEIYHAASEGAAREALEEFSDKWDAKYPSISRKWRSHWEELITIFKYPHNKVSCGYYIMGIQHIQHILRRNLTRENRSASGLEGNCFLFNCREPVAIRPTRSLIIKRP
jgi:transposase-like protein